MLRTVFGLACAVVLTGSDCIGIFIFIELHNVQNIYNKLTCLYIIDVEGDSRLMGRNLNSWHQSDTTRLVILTIVFCFILCFVLFFNYCMLDFICGHIFEYIKCSPSNTTTSCNMVW